MFNSFSAAVRATRDAEVKNFGETKMCVVGLCTSTNQKIKDEWVENTLFFKGVMFGNASDRLATVKKGDLLIVTGQLVNRSYKDKDGVAHSDLNLEINRFEPVVYQKKDNGTGDLPF